MIPLSKDARIALEHGAGGRAMRALIEEVFLGPAATRQRADMIGLGTMDDGAAIKVGDRWLVITTDSHVIHPIFFPGGDIGRLSICGTVNDLAMMGATEPLALTCSVILEDGFERSRLVEIVSSMRAACAEAGTIVITGDTKVMGRGEVDAIVLNTTGIGLTDRVVEDSGLSPGDRILVTGTIGDHGLAVMAARHKLDIQGDLRSDVAPLNGLVRAALDAGGSDVVAMKDPTRGGVASALTEMAEKSGLAIVLEEARLPVTPAVRGAAELLGIDPLHVANEGKALIGVKPRSAERVLEALRGHPLGARADIIGTCTEGVAGRVILDTGFGRRLVVEPEGEPLPRIC